MSARPTVRAYIGLGANLGDAERTLADAIAAIEALRGIVVRGVSRLYATAPWGVVDQPEFRNAAIAIVVTRRSSAVAADALDLLASLKSIEHDAGRKAGVRWGPRELDLDILLFGRHRIDVERPPDARSLDADVDPARAARRLEVPHRELADRLFVLAPLADLAPRLVPPGWTQTIEARRRALAETEPPGSVRVTGEWHAAAGRWRPVEPRARQTV